MNIYVVKKNKHEVRLYIGNEKGELSVAYLTIDQVEKRVDLHDYFEIMKIKQKKLDEEPF